MGIHELDVSRCPLGALRPMDPQLLACPAALNRRLREDPPVFCPRARPCSLNHRRGYAFGREHAHAGKILGDHRGPWCNMRASVLPHK